MSKQACAHSNPKSERIELFNPDRGLPGAMIQQACLTAIRKPNGLYRFFVAGCNGDT
jgi:hypothetical protein